jgi:hypothetical protein
MQHARLRFVAFKGVPSLSTMNRVKQFLWALEGVFRLLPKDSACDNECIP